MVADGGDWNGGIVRQVAFPKITRAPDGSLWGATGSAGDCYLLREWVLAGCDMKAKPFFVGKDDEQIGIVMAKPDGSLWGGAASLALRPCPAPAAYGAPSASCFCEGAMQAGLSASEAMRLTIENCEWAFGEMQVEHLHPAPKVMAINADAINQGTLVEYDRLTGLPLPPRQWWMQTPRVGL